MTESYEHKWRAFTAIGVSFVTVVMSMTMVFVALAPIADDFDVTLRAVGWVVIVESLIISAVMLPLGRLADAVGHKRVHLLGLTLFGVGAALTGLSTTFGMLIGGRVVMALGSSMTQAVGTGMVVAVFPPEERGKAIGSQTTAVSIGAASGPILGGLLLQVLSWQALFLMLLVPVVISLIAGSLWLDEEQVSSGAGAKGARFDTWGAVVSAAAITAMVITVSNPFAVPWLSPATFGGAAIAAVAGVAFVRIEGRHEAPMLELHLFSIPAFSYGIAARLAGFTAASFANLLLPIYLISVRGLSTGAAGGVLFLTSLGMGLSAQVSGRLSDRRGARPLVIGGFVLAATTGLGFAHVELDTSLWLLSIAVLLAGVAMGTWNVPNNSSILGSVPQNRLGVIGAFTNLTRTIGTVVGQAIASAVVVGAMVARGVDVPLSEIAETDGASAAFMVGWRIDFVIVLVLSLLGLLMALRINGPSRRPASRRL
ncbi:MAG: MFS transporter [Actinomycetia bacterium]|nr:MFS transporter [Actinomycetes bacterium]